MFIVQIIGALLSAIGLFLFMEFYNRHTLKHEGIEFFTKESFGYFAIANVVMYIGWNMIQSNWHGDPLNGLIIMIIGSAIMLKRIRDNFIAASFWTALKGTLLQILIFIPLSVIALIGIIALFAAASGVKPVYNLNSRD